MLVVVGPQPLRSSSLRPATPADRVEGQRPELVEGEDPIGPVPQHLLDAVELGLLVRVVRLLPGLGPLEGHLVFVQDLTQPLPADPDPPEPGCSPGTPATCERSNGVKGRPTFSGRSLAVWTMNSSSSVVIRRGRPPAHLGSNERIPFSLNRWIISRTRSGLVCTRRAITSTVFPPGRGQHHHRPPIAHHAHHRLAPTSAHDALQACGPPRRSDDAPSHAGTCTNCDHPLDTGGGSSNGPRIPVRALALTCWQLDDQAARRPGQPG